MTPSTYLSAAEIRSAFLEFFAARDHALVRSSPVVPRDDPTLLFTNAGMNQFKANFLGLDRSLQRATTAQKCIRAGGKHNDLDNVGYTARHHTFFEMLGNFSFGDYFKREAIGWAWELLTRVYRLPPDRLWATVYFEDDEAYDIWLREINLPAERIVRIGDNKGARYLSDNFWMMGDTGPCGPCSEIFYDRGPEVPGGPPGSPDEDGDRYTEIWNLVFTQFNRDAEGHMERLPRPNIDTGMGLERLASVLQGVPSNYDIDLFRDLMRAAREAVCSAGAGEVDPGSPSLRVIADHIRACAFAVADGVAPGNEGRAYVLRRICRRAIRHGYKLGARGPFFYQLVEPLAGVMGEVYPELRDPGIAAILRGEEERFLQTLSRGMEILEAAIAETRGRALDGELAFKLHDTYGFPSDLTADVCRERGLSVDMARFDAAMEKQRAMARAAGRFKAAAGLPYDGPASEFVGYERLELTETKVLAVYRDGVPVDALRAGDEGLLVLDRTPFYAEMGGQVGDMGQLSNDTALLTVSDTFRLRPGVFGHSVHVREGEVRPGDALRAAVDRERRLAIARNHSATHLMHKALREVLGPRVAQKGSLVNERVTRFDFSHDQPMSAEQIARVEDLVNAEILANTAVGTRIMPLAEARDCGAVMLFGEKYGDTVRVLDIGSSRELCGGTHVARTGDIGSFRVLSESGISAGVRRVEAVTGLNALRQARREAGLLGQAGALFRSPADEVPDKVSHLLERQRELEKELAAAKARLAGGQSRDLAARAEELGGHRVLVASVAADDAAALRSAMDELKSRLGSAVILLARTGDGKLQLCAGVTGDLTDRVRAGELVSHAAAAAGGRGGGKPDLAMAGAPDASRLDEALAAGWSWIAERLG